MEARPAIIRAIGENIENIDVCTLQKKLETLSNLLRAKDQEREKIESMLLQTKREKDAIERDVAKTNEILLGFEEQMRILVLENEKLNNILSENIHDMEQDKDFKILYEQSLEENRSLKKAKGDTVKDLEDKIRLLVDDNDKMSKALTENILELENLREEVVVTARATATLEKADEKVRAMSKEKEEQYIQEIQELKDKLKDFTNEANKKIDEQKGSEYKEKCYQLLTINDALNVAIDEKNREIARLNERKSDYKTDEFIIRQLYAEKEELNKILADKNLEAKRYFDATEELNLRVNSYETHINEHRQESVNASEKFKQLLIFNETLNTLLEGASDDCDKVKEELRNKMRMLQRGYEQKITTLLEEQSKLTEVNYNHTKTIDELNKKVNELRATTTSLGEMRDRNEMAEYLIRDMENKLTILHEDNLLLNEKLQNKILELSQKDRTLIELTNYQKSTGEEMLTMRNKLSELDQRFQHAVLESDRLSRLVGDKEAYLKNATIEKEATERALDMIRRDFQSKSEKEQQMHSKLLELETKSMRLVSENDRLQRIVGDKDLQINQLKEIEMGYWALKEVERTVRERDELIETQRSRIVVLETKFENLLANFEQLSMIMADSERKNFCKEETVKSAATERELIKSARRKDNLDVVPEEDECYTSRSHRQELTNKEISSYKEQILVLEERVRELSGYNDELRGLLECHKNEQAHEEHEKSYMNNLLDLENKFNILVIENDKLSQALLERNSENSVMPVLQNTISDLQHAISGYEAQIEAFNIEKRELLKHIEEKQKIIVSIQSQQDIFKQNKFESDEGLKSELQILSNKYEYSANENLKLKEEITFMERERESWEMKLGDFTNSLSSLKVDYEMREEQLRVMRAQNDELIQVNNLLKSLNEQKERQGNLLVDRRVELLQEEIEKLLASRNDYLSVTNLNSEKFKSLGLISERQKNIEEICLWMGRYKDLLGKLVYILSNGDPAFDRDSRDNCLSLLREENERLKLILTYGKSEEQPLGISALGLAQMESKIEVLNQENSKLKALLEAKMIDTEFWMKKSIELESYLDNKESQDIGNISNIIAERESLLFSNRSLKQEVDFLQNHIKSLMSLSEARGKEFVLEKESLLRANEEILIENANQKGVFLKLELHLQAKNKELDLWIQKYNNLTVEVDGLKLNFEKIYGTKEGKASSNELSMQMATLKIEMETLSNENERLKKEIESAKLLTSSELSRQSSSNELEESSGKREQESGQLKYQIKQLKLVNENNQLEINKLHQRLKDKKTKDLETEDKMHELMNEIKGIYSENERIFREKECIVRELEKKSRDLEKKTEELEKFKIEFEKTWRHVDELDSKMKKMESST